MACLKEVWVVEGCAVGQFELRQPVALMVGRGPVGRQSEKEQDALAGLADFRPSWLAWPQEVVSSSTARAFANLSRPPRYGRLPLASNALLTCPVPV